ncbi:MAG: poly-gamma-glutamate biosynthesis protein PgsC [Candidatus Atribacteria bacterium]|nr:poly-gamma-glutamate biosynthesis protein PgsC [Candidatus Atribacteria bacterium]
MIYQAIGIGIMVSFAFYEIVGFSPGGIVVPGYVALFLDQPIRILVTLLVALLTYFAVKILSNYIILYGRRRFLTMVLVSFLLKWLIEEMVIKMPISGIELRSIGYIIPGLIANEMRRQGIFPTIYSLAIVSILVRLILLLFLKS